MVLKYIKKPTKTPSNLGVDIETGLDIKLIAIKEWISDAELIIGEMLSLV